MRIGSRSGRREAGFAYVLLLLAVALLSIAATAAVSLGATMTRRDAERELLAIGVEFHQALRSYAGPASGALVPNGSRGPQSLEDLVKDPRVPSIRRHLRKVYADPLTGKTEWGLVLDSQGRIVGVHSLAVGKPIRQDGFEPEFAALEHADSYRQWVFGLARIGQPVGAEGPARR